MRPIRSPTLLPIRMNAAETSASSAIADWTPLTVVSRSWTTAEIDTFISDVSTTSTNIAIASSSPSFETPAGAASACAVSAWAVSWICRFAHRDSLLASGTTGTLPFTRVRRRCP